MTLGLPTQECGNELQNLVSFEEIQAKGYLWTTSMSLMVDRLLIQNLQNSFSA